jgi:hypothetical protein
MPAFRGARLAFLGKDGLFGEEAELDTTAGRAVKCPLRPASR